MVDVTLKSRIFVHFEISEIILNNFLCFLLFQIGLLISKISDMICKILLPSYSLESYVFIDNKKNTRDTFLLNNNVILLEKRNHSRYPLISLNCSFVMGVIALNWVSVKLFSSSYLQLFSLINSSRNPSKCLPLLSF